MSKNVSKEAMFWDETASQCSLCPHYCKIKENHYGRCGVRKNIHGKLIAESYAQITSAAIDPIEKKPLAMFHPGAKILSVGSYGCNFFCPFCQNHDIAMPKGQIYTEIITPEKLTALALQATQAGNIGIAYTYNEPLIGYEYVYDTAKLIKAAGLKNILVTNGFIAKEPLEMLLPTIDAMNIDLKGFTNDFYKKVGGSADTVKDTIKRASKTCHVEVTTLVIPDENESDVENIVNWLAEIDPHIPLHLSRFFPQNKYAERASTAYETMLTLAALARKQLKYVFLGNMD